MARPDAGILKRIFGPHPSLKRISDRRNSLLLGYLLVGLFAGFGVLNIVYLLTSPGYVTPWQSLVGYLLLAAAFGLNRLGLYRPAAAIPLLTFPFVQFSEVLSGSATDPSAALTYLVLGIILAGIFLDTLATLGFSALILAGIVLMPVAAPNGLVDQSMVIAPGAVCAIGSALVLLTRLQRDKIERERRSELERYQNHLEALVAERTNELEAAHSEILATERMAVLGRLTATVSHELRNPLGTVSNSLYTIREVLNRNEPNRAEPMLERARRNVARCDRIISDLLDYTRATIRELRPLELDSWVRSVVEETLESLDSKPDLRLELGAGVMIAADHERLGRALVNVLTNAIQASPEGTVTVSTAIDQEPATGTARVEIRVTDTGTGMDTETLSRAFEPLFSTKAYGVGLGLSVVKTVMSEHRGGIEFDTTPGQGTTATLWLPGQAAS